MYLSWLYLSTQLDMNIQDHASLTVFITCTINDSY